MGDFSFNHCFNPRHLQALTTNQSLSREFPPYPIWALGRGLQVSNTLIEGPGYWLQCRGGMGQSNSPKSGSPALSLQGAWSLSQKRRRLCVCLRNLPSF